MTPISFEEIAPEFLKNSEGKEREAL